MVVVNTNDMRRAVAFWTGALGWEIPQDDTRFLVLQDPVRRRALLSLQLTNETKFSRNRLHLDIFDDEQEGEIARLEALGAERITWNHLEDDDFVVMVDPDDNGFSVIQNNLVRDA